MADDFKLKVKVVLDDTGFKSGLDNLQSQGEQFSKSFTNSMFGAMTAANLASKGVEFLMSTLKSAVNEFTMLDTNLAKVNTLLDQQVLSTTNLRMELLRVSSATGIYASELANASYEALSAGVETQNLTEFIEDMTTLSQGGFTSVTQAVNVATSIMNAYGKEVYTAKEISDKLVKTQAQGKITVDELSRTLYNVIPIASSLGVSLDEVLASISLITKSGTPAAQATTQMKSALADLTDEATGAGKKFKEITGKTFPDFVRAGGTLNEAIKILGEYSRQANVPLTTIFGQIEAGQGALILAADGANNFSKEIDGVKKSAGEAEKAQKTATENMAQQWKTLATTLKNEFLSDEAGAFTLMNKAVFNLSKAMIQFLTYDADKGMKVLEKNFQETATNINKLRKSLGLETIEYDITKQSLDQLKAELAELESKNNVRKVYYETQSGFGGQEMEADYEKEADARAKEMWKKRQQEIADRLAKEKADTLKQFTELETSINKIRKKLGLNEVEYDIKLVKIEDLEKDLKEVKNLEREYDSNIQEQKRAARELELREYNKFRIDKANAQSDFDIQQLEKDIEFFNQISSIREQGFMSEQDIDLLYDDYKYEKFLEEQAFKLEQLESDAKFYADKKQYAEEYAQTIANIKQIEAENAEAALNRQAEVKEREISLTNTWNKRKEGIYRSGYNALVNSNKNILKAMGDFAIKSVAQIMLETGQELFVRGLKDKLIGGAKATLTATNPVIAAEGVRQMSAGALEMAQGLALGAAGAAVGSVGGDSGGSEGGGVGGTTGYTDDINERESFYSVEQEKTVTIYTDGDMKDVMLSMLGTLNDLAKDYSNIQIISK